MSTDAAEGNAVHSGIAQESASLWAKCAQNLEVDHAPLPLRQRSARCLTRHYVLSGLSLCGAGCHTSWFARKQSPHRDQPPEPRQVLVFKSGNPASFCSLTCTALVCEGGSWGNTTNHCLWSGVAWHWIRGFVTCRFRHPEYVSKLQSATCTAQVLTFCPQMICCLRRRFVGCSYRSRYATSQSGVRVQKLFTVSY